MREVPGVEYVAVCDVQEQLASGARDWAGRAVVAYGDFRRVLDRHDVDAVHIATPDHWHALVTVMACSAGKHVYVEKPLSHNVREGRAMVEAARRHRRIVHTGTQHRSAPHYREVQEIVRSGGLGEVRFVRVWSNFNMLPDGIGRAPDGPVPPGVDWDMYVGPAPMRPYNPKRIGPTFRWFQDYANGVVTDYGVHRLDTVHQVMGVEAPLTVAAAGGRFALNDMGEMPDVLQVTYEYPKFVLSYESSCLNAHGVGGRTPGMRYYNARGATDRPHGEAFYGSKGTIFSDRIGYEVFPEGDRVEPRRRQSEDATGAHARRFVDCVRGLAKSNADVEVGHRSNTVALLGNIALKTGRKLRWDSVKEEFPGDTGANRLLARAARKPWDLI
jgi:predicted dehydrogenase